MKAIPVMLGILSLIAVGVGIVVDVQDSQCIEPLSLVELQAVRGGETEICYIPATLVCGLSPENCGGPKCKPHGIPPAVNWDCESDPGIIQHGLEDSVERPPPLPGYLDTHVQTKEEWCNTVYVCGCEEQQEDGNGEEYCTDSPDLWRSSTPSENVLVHPLKDQWEYDCPSQT
ncbi:MAG: hypothetical protein KJZ87_01200 [Thermoguttaceae bacterium]|nr:hypothetical protein [Thermoguttaceae bacterium]